MIRTRRDGPTAVITLARADKRNALTPEMLSELSALVWEAGPGGYLTDDSTDNGLWYGARALLLEGDGPVFCSGFDLSFCQQSTDGAVMRRFLEDLAWCVWRMRTVPIPVVIAAHGGAIAGGCALLGGADVVVTDRAAKLGYPVVRIGVSPAVSAPNLRLSIGDGWCRDRLLDSRLIDGLEGTRIGLTHECCDTAEQARARALAVALELAGKPAHAMRATRDWINEIESCDEQYRGWHADFDRSSRGRALAVSRSLAGSAEERAGIAAALKR